jgi:GxxExxY protein
MPKDRVFQLCDIIRETGFAIHEYLGPGHLEKVYEKAIAHRLGNLPIQFLCQEPLAVHDEDGFVLGDFQADMFVEEILIVEIKAVRSLVNEHVAQLLGYMRASGIEHGLLVNFGAGRFEIRKYVWSKGQWKPSGDGLD